MGLLETRTLGFIGLGAMGHPMALRLAERLPPGAHMYVYDVVPSAMESVQAAHPGKVQIASSPKDVASHANLIITMVPEGKHVRAVYLDPVTGIVAADSIAGHVLLDCSTIDTATNLAVKQHLEDGFAGQNVLFYDAPVSGGVVGAERGTLAVFLGCAEPKDGTPGDANFAALAELLLHIGARVVGCGGPSLGLATKLSNNYLSGLVSIALSEAMNMGIRAGLDPRVLARAFHAGTAQNAICDKFNPVPGVQADAHSSHGYRGGFKVELMRKDFGLAVAMAQAGGARLVLGPVGQLVYEAAALDSRCTGLDSRVVYRYLGGVEDWEAMLGKGEKGGEKTI